MAELNFGLLTPPGSQSIGNAFVTGMDQAAAARQMENQNALSQYTLSKARREDEVNNRLLNDLRAAKTPQEQRQAYINAGRAKDAAEMESALLKNQELQGKINLQPGAAARAQAQTEASIAAKARSRQEFEGQAIRDLGINPSDDNIRALGQDALIKGIYTPEEMAQKVDKFLAVPLAERAATFSKYGAAAPTPQQPRQPNLAADLLIPGPNGTMAPNTALVDVRKTLAEAGRSPGTTVNVDTKVGNKYGETFAKDIGEADSKLRSAALDAPTMAANANQTLKLLEDPKIFTGGAAPIKLELARALNVIGETDATSIANTEKLIQSTGRATLDSIKTSGLGTGQGFTDKDLKMLQGVAGGTITLNADTLRSFATAQHNAAQAIVKKWESRRTNIPTAALSGTGIDKETYTLEPKYSPYVETKTAPDGRRLGKKADGTVEVIK
jgi:hypothetical protein